MDNTIMMSIDGSTKSTGIAIFENGELIKKLCIQLSIKDTTERTNETFSLITKLINKFNVSIVVIEDYIYTKNIQTFKILNEFLGVVKGYCFLNSIFFCTLSPSQWRRYAKDKKETLPRKREELKKWSIDKVKAMYDLEVIDDVADAILLGIGYTKMIKECEKNG